MESDENYNPFQSPSVEPFAGDPSHLPKSVSFLRTAIATTLVSVVLGYATLLAQFVPALPKPLVPFAGLAAFGLVMAAICGFAGRGRIASVAMLRVAVAFVSGWLLYLTVIHVVSRSGLSSRDFSVIAAFVVGSAVAAVVATFVRHWRTSAGKLSGFEAARATGTERETVDA